MEGRPHCTRAAWLADEVAGLPRTGAMARANNNYPSCKANSKTMELRISWRQFTLYVWWSLCLKNGFLWWSPPVIFFGGRGDLIFHVAHSSCTSFVFHVRPSKFDVRRLDFVKPTRGVKVLEPKKIQEKFNTGRSQHLKLGCECIFFRRTCGTFFLTGRHRPFLFLYLPIQCFKCCHCP